VTYPSTTAAYAAVFALIYLGLSGWVIAGRLRGNVLHGTGPHDALLRQVRSQGNFGEYVPFALLLIALLEAGGAGHGLVQGLLLVLLVARLLHPFGMFATPNSPRQFACRGGGIIATMGVIAVAAVALLVRVL
jgi:uncharacterized protein